MANPDRLLTTSNTVFKKLVVCLFDDNGNEYVSKFHIRVNVNSVHVDKHILDELVTIGVLAGPIAFHHLAFQVDANENVIRIRDIGDVLGEPGNLKCMINLRPTKD